MMMRVTALYLLFLTMTTGHPSAQQRPDFSGEWRPIGGDAAPPTPPGGGPPPPPRTLAITITQSPGELKIARRVESEGREAVYNFTYKVDGTETVNPMGPLVFYSRASWQGESLVVASDVGADDRRIGTLREIYVLEDGKLTVETSRTGPAGTMKSKTVHERVIAPSRKAPAGNSGSGKTDPGAQTSHARYTLGRAVSQHYRAAAHYRRARTPRGCGGPSLEKVKCDRL